MRTREREGLLGTDNDMDGAGKERMMRNGNVELHDVLERIEDAVVVREPSELEVLSQGRAASAGPGRALAAMFSAGEGDFAERPAEMERRHDARTRVSGRRLTKQKGTCTRPSSAAETSRTSRILLTARKATPIIERNTP